MWWNRSNDQLEQFAQALDSDEVLEGLGLMRRTDQINWLWPALGGLGLGLLCGVATGFALAPKKGAEWRGEVAGRLRNRDFRGLADAVRGSSGTAGVTSQASMPGRSNPVI